jgi:hypothetical protein
MPEFWVEQKFIMNIENASQIKFALDIPCIGQMVGIVMTLTGIILMSITHLKRLCCKLGVKESKNDEIAKGTVIKDYEMNPLMSKTQNCHTVKT